MARTAGAEGATLYEAADRSGDAIGQLKPGEAFSLLDVTGDWAWGYRTSDHLVGYVPASQLAPL